MAGKRVDLAGAAELLGVKIRTVERYAKFDYVPPAGREPYFPAADKNSTWSVRSLERWSKARRGQGRPAGGKRSEDAWRACEVCGTKVPRRAHDELDDKMKCIPCYKQAARVRQEASDERA